MAVRKIRNSWWVDFRHWGIRYRKRSPHDSKSAAKEYEALLRQKLSRGEPLQASRSAGLTFADFASQWLDTYVRANNKPSEQQAKALLLRVHLIPWFGKLQLSTIRTSDVESYKAKKRAQQLSAKTINNHLAVLGKCLRTAAEWDVIQAVPRILPLRAPRPAFDFLAPEESVRLLEDHAEPTWRLMALVALRTGLRRGELCALDWSDVDFEHGIITVRRRIYRGLMDVPKSNRIRHIPMTEDLRAEFTKVRRQNGLVFHRPDGSPLASSSAATALLRMCERVKLRRIGWHVFRHTFASQLVSYGVPLPAVQELLGHSSITMTMRYAHLAPSALRDAIAALNQANTCGFGQQAVNAPSCEAGKGLESSSANDDNSRSMITKNAA